MQERDPYKIPPELAALENKTYIFQLHYGNDSTKEQRFFFLDKAWEITPAIAALPDAHTETLPAKSTIQTETTTTPVPEETNITESSATKAEKITTRTRRALFQTTEGEIEASGSKKSKKLD